ncbi:MAG TPA: hypothetical protein VK453_01165 [Micromonosporaceae bacterium]|nr:hypothetical protein [Micromonosporaceae bacterium]
MSAVMTGAVLVLMLGWVMGRSMERARRAHVDHTKTRTLVGGLRKTAWRETGQAIRATLVITAVFAVMFVMAWRGGR